MDDDIVVTKEFIIALPEPIAIIYTLLTHKPNTNQTTQ